MKYEFLKIGSLTIRIDSIVATNCLSKTILIYVDGRPSPFEIESSNGMFEPLKQAIQSGLLSKLGFGIMDISNMPTHEEIKQKSFRNIDLGEIENANHQ